MNDYEAHLGSYDHSHRQRMKDMKQMVKDPTAGARARKAEAKADGLISIKLGEAGASSSTMVAAAAGSATGASGGGGFKKGGFKKSGFKSAFAPIGGGGGGGGAPAAAEESVPDDGNSARETVRKVVLMDENVESDTEDEGYEVYDPRQPTD